MSLHEDRSLIKEGIETTLGLDDPLSADWATRPNGRRQTMRKWWNGKKLATWHWIKCSGKWAEIRTDKEILPRWELNLRPSVWKTTGWEASLDYFDYSIDLKCQAANVSSLSVDRLLGKQTAKFALHFIWAVCPTLFFICVDRWTNNPWMLSSKQGHLRNSHETSLASSSPSLP